MAQICPICNNPLDEGAASCPHCGYHALGSTQSFTPLRFGANGELQSEPVAQRFELRIVRGPQTGMDISLREGAMSVGRDPQCDIFLNDMTVSRKHATIEVSKDGCIIRDAKSFNGVWVNDRSVEACLLKSGDVIQIGTFCLVYRER